MENNLKFYFTEENLFLVGHHRHSVIVFCPGALSSPPPAQKKHIHVYYIIYHL